MKEQNDASQRREAFKHTGVHTHKAGREIVIDGKRMILGRASTMVAKKLLGGEKVHIINSEQMIITGNPLTIKEKYLERRRRGSVVSGPFFPIRPDLVVRRTIRGMLPYKTNKGRAAFKNLRVHIGNSGMKELIDENVSTPLASKHTGAGLLNEKSESAKIKTRFITVGKLSESLGWDKKK